MVYRRKSSNFSHEIHSDLKIISIALISVCTGLPEDWIGVKTETEFPVDTGTTITVSCQEGYINTGSKIVTCNTYLYQDFQYDTKPTCLLGKNNEIN